MNDGKELIEQIEEQYGFYYDQMKCRKDKSLLRQFYEAVKALLSESAGLDFVGCEICKVYYDMAEKRFK